VVFDGEMLPTRIYRRDALAPGQVLATPAVVEEPSCTIVIPPETEAEVDAWGQIILTFDRSA
jgi:N-methylhydantoinase A